MGLQNTSESSAAPRSTQRAPFVRHGVFAAFAAASLFATALVSSDTPEPERDTAGLVAEAGFIGRLLTWVEGMLGGPALDDPPVQEDVW